MEVERVTRLDDHSSLDVGAIWRLSATKKTAKSQKPLTIEKTKKEYLCKYTVL